MGSQGFSTTADLVLVAVSVQPQTEVTQSAGVVTGERQAIRVTRAMETNAPDIFAAGDCVETWHRLLGTQMVGHYHGEIAKRIDIFSTALFHGMRVDDLNSLDLSYTPPVSSPWDPVQMSAQAWVRAHEDTHDGAGSRLP